MSTNIFNNMEYFRYINRMSAFENNFPLFQVPEGLWHLKNLFLNLVITGIGALALWIYLQLWLRVRIQMQSPNLKKNLVQVKNIISSVNLQTFNNNA